MPKSITVGCSASTVAQSKVLTQHPTCLDAGPGRSAPLAVRCFALLVSLCLAGCATHADQLVRVRGHFYSGDLVAADMAAAERLKKNGDDADVLRLDQAMIALADGRAKEAETTLRQVRDRFDHLEQASAGELALSMLSDDNTRAYAGEDYEKILIRAYLAISNLMTDGGDATAYALQVTQKQQEIIDNGASGDGERENPKLAYKQVALGPYLHGLIREQTHSNYDDALRAYRQVAFVEPEFRLAHDDIRRAEHGHHSARGHGVLYVFAMVGRGPYKVETLETPTTAALMIADFIMKSQNKYSLPISQAPVKVPKVVSPVNRVDNVLVRVGGQPAGRTETITDVGRLAVQQYDAIYAQVVARAIVRRVVKRAVIEGGKRIAGVDSNSPINLAFDAAEFAWGATESADTRCWGLLPDKIQVCRIELPAGDHEIALTPALGPAPIGIPHASRVRVADGRNSYLLAHFPDHKLVGKIVASQ